MYCRRKDQRKLKVRQQSGLSRTTSFAWTVLVLLLMSSDGSHKEQTLHFRYLIQLEDTPSTTPLLCLRLHTRSENEQLGGSVDSWSTKRWLLSISLAISENSQTWGISALFSSIPNLMNICSPSESLLSSPVSLMIRRCFDRRRATILVDLRRLSAKGHFRCQKIHCRLIQLFLLRFTIACWPEVWSSLVLSFHGHTKNWVHRSYWKKTLVQETCEFFR